MLQPRVLEPRGETRRNLERLERLIEQEAWDELCTIADGLLASPGEGWVTIGPDSYVGVREAVHRRLAALPPQGLAAYRRRADSLAKPWFEQGVAERDGLLLQRVVDEAFCSSVGDDALWALGEIALERGDYLMARTYWQRIQQDTASGGLVAYPDSSIDIAQVRSRLILVSIREGDLERAARRIKEFEQDHPEAAGRLAGAEGNLARRLRSLLGEARTWPEPTARQDWPTLFANPRRSSVVELSLPANAGFDQAWSIELDSPMAEASLVPQPITFPIFTDDKVLFSDASGIRVISLKASDVPAEARTLLAAEAAPTLLGATLGADRRKVFAVVYDKSSRGETLSSRLVGIDLDRDGALMFEQRPARADTNFVGTPIVADSYVVVCELTQAQGLQTSIACYDMGTAQLVWRRSLGWAFDAAQFNGAQPVHPELAHQERTVFVNTNLGMIAALRLDSGEPRWMRTYDRSLSSRQREEVTAIVRPPNPCIVDRSAVFVAPNDASFVLAFDAISGEQIWSAPSPGADADLLAIDGDHLLLTGERLWRLDADTGRFDPDWGDALRDGAGQGAVAGEIIFWPTAGDIMLVKRTTGRPLGRSLPLPSAGGAHLVIGSGTNREAYLVAAGPTKVTGYRVRFAQASMEGEAPAEPNLGEGRRLGESRALPAFGTDGD